MSSTENAVSQIDREAPADDDLAASSLVPRRQPGRWAAAVIAVVLFAMVVHTLAINPRFERGTVGQYFTRRTVLAGLWLTLWLTAVNELIASGVYARIFRKWGVTSCGITKSVINPAPGF